MDNEQLTDDLMFNARTLVLMAETDIDLAEQIELLDRSIEMLMEARNNLRAQTWCNWCGNLRTECCCAQDPNGIPAGHWSVAERMEVLA